MTEQQEQAATSAAQIRPLDRRSWWGRVDKDAAGILARLQEQFPVGSHVAVSATVGDWHHDLSIERVDEIKQYDDPNHLGFITDRYVRGMSDDNNVSFSYDYRGCRFEVRTKNGSGEPIHWIFIAIEPELEQ